MASLKVQTPRLTCHGAQIIARITTKHSAGLLSTGCSLSECLSRKEPRGSLLLYSETAIVKLHIYNAFIHFILFEKQWDWKTDIFIIVHLWCVKRHASGTTHILLWNRLRGEKETVGQSSHEWRKRHKLMGKGLDRHLSLNHTCFIFQNVIENLKNLMFQIKYILRFPRRLLSKTPSEFCRIFRKFLRTKRCFYIQ